MLPLFVFTAALSEGVGAEEPGSRLEFHISPVVDLHYYARAMVRGALDDVPDACRELVATMKSVDRTLGGKWGTIEGNLEGCRTARELRERLAGLPTEYRPRSGPPGETIALREMALKLADAYIGCEAHFLEHTWPAHRQVLQQDLKRIESDFVPHYDKLLTYMLEHLGIADPRIVVPVYLMAEAPFPGAFTKRTHRGTPVVFVQTRRGDVHRDTLLFEIILHESCHTLDMGNESVFRTLREKLAEAGLSRRVKLYRDVPHTVMFVQAAESIRRILDKNHKAYGEVEGYYRRVGAAGRIVPPIWIDYLDGRLTREEAINRMVKAATEVRSSE